MKQIGQEEQPFLVQHLEDLPNKPHTAYPEFGDMAARCAKGDADAMEALADWFEQWSQREDDPRSKEARAKAREFLRERKTHSGF